MAWQHVILDEIVPQLPTALQDPVQAAVAQGRLKRMPNTFFPAAEQGQSTKEGAFLVGDSWNMRHPLTGGGMTVAFNDVVILQELFAGVRDLSDWKEVAALLHTWHWRRKPLAATVNVLSVALYDLFGADSPDLAVLRTGCFKYFELGGRCVEGPVSLLAATKPSLATLFVHFFAVAFYSLWVLFTHPRPVRVGAQGKMAMRRPRPDEWPALVLRSVSVVCRPSDVLVQR